MTIEVPGACSIPGAQWGPIATFLGVVKSLPFEGSFELNLVERDRYGGVNSEKKITGSIYRDSDGRFRRDYRAQVSGEQMIEVTAIVDVAIRTVVALDVAAKMSRIFTNIGPEPGSAHLEGWGFTGAWSLERPAVEKVIEGVLCRRAKREGWPLGSALKSEEGGELWVSDEIKLSVFEHVSDPGRERTWRLYDIRRVEPPSALFVIPSGYTEVVMPKLGMAPPKQ